MFNAGDVMTEETPYPHVGEIVHFIVHAFGLFGRGDDLRKRLSRFAKEKDFNIAEANTLIDKALLEPLRKIDSALATNIQAWLTKLLDDYKTIILTVPTNMAARTTIIKILIDELFVPSTLVFMKKLPDSALIEKWFESGDTIAVKEVLSWWMQTNGVSEKELIDALCRYYDNDDESIRRLLQRWKQGNGLPEIGSLLKFKHLNSLVSWLLLARAWQYTTQVFAKTFGDKELFIRLVHNLYQKKREGFDPDCVRVRVEPLDKHFLNNCLAPVFEISLDEEKTVGDEIRAQAALKNFEQNELSPYFRYFYEEGWGDYYALRADYEQALKHYQKAFEHGAYRAGEYLLDILRKLLMLAAFLGKKNIINQYYRWASVMGLFSEDHNVPQLWEIEKFRMAFFNHFPPHGLYQCVDKQIKVNMEKTIEQESIRKICFSKDWKKRPLYLRYPNRKFKDCGPRARTQLMMFAMDAQNDKLKRLLEHGADPKIQASDGSTALMAALQNNNQEGAKLLLQYELGDSINARTKRQNITTLQVAIDNADLSVIRRIIEKGADVEQACDYGPMTPLYHALNLIGTKKERLKTTMMKVSADFFRRASPEIFALFDGCVFDNDFETSIFKRLVEYIDDINDEKFEDLMDFNPLVNFNFSRFLGVIDLLIEAGADVNKRQSDVSGKVNHSSSSFTPFLLSAELGNIEIFRRLYKAGGNLTDCTDLDFTILTLALHLHKFELVTYILKNCDQNNLRSIVNIQDKREGNTAVHWALRAFFIERKLKPKFWRILEKLLILEPDLSLKNKEGLTAAEMAARCGMPSFALELYRREVTHEKCSTTPTSEISSAH
jgi:ankyrin repeat protein/DNA-binding transcriptional MerR regulator